MADKTGGILARVGTPAGASLAADVLLKPTKVEMDAGLALLAPQNAIQPVLCEFFQNAADAGAPNTAYWSVVITGDSIVQVTYAPSRLRLYAGASAANEGIAHTDDKIQWVASGKYGTTLLNFRAIAKCVDLTGNFCIGLMNSNSAYVPTDFVGTTVHAGFYCNNDVVTATSADGVAAESTDISAYFTQNTYLQLDVIISATYAKFYINGTLRATHSTRFPTTTTLMKMIGSKNTNSVRTDLNVQYSKAWAE